MIQKAPVRDELMEKIKVLFLGGDRIRFPEGMSFKRLPEGGQIMK